MTVPDGTSIDTDGTSSDAVDTSIDTLGTGPRTLAMTYLAGASAGLIVLLFVLLAGGMSVLQRAPTGLMYDAQAHSMSNGRWDVPAAVSSIETFVSHGRTYIYFGPFPALLRMPLLALTSRFDGRLSQISMLVSFVMTALASTAIVHEIAHRCAFRRPSRFAQLVFVAVGFVVMGGSVVTFLAFRGDVYNEAIAWGLATCLAAIAALLRALRTGSGRWMIVSGLFAAASIESRITMGASASAALGLVVLASFNRRTRDACGLPERTSRGRDRRSLVVAIAIPVVVFFAVQFTKWHSLVVKPSQHLVNQTSAQFPNYVAHNGDSYFSIRFVPSNFLATVVWPSGLHTMWQFPWIAPDDLDFGPTPGHPTFLGQSWTGSLAFTQSLLFVLAIAGIVLVFGWCLLSRTVLRRRPPRPAPPGLRELRPIAIGAATGFFATIAYSYQYHRFLADAMPMVVLLAVVGAAAVCIAARHRRWMAVSVGLVVALGLWSVWVNVATAVLAQTTRAFAPEPAAVDQLTRIQLAFGSVPPLDHVALGDQFPAPSAIGRLLDIGDCDALYVSAGQDGLGIDWSPVALGPLFRRRLELQPSSLPTGDVATIIDDGTTAVSFDRGPDGAGRLVADAPGQHTEISLGSRSTPLLLERRPGWTVLRITARGQAFDVPWTGQLPAGSLDGPGVDDHGGDDTSTCRDLRSAS